LLHHFGFREFWHFSSRFSPKYFSSCAQISSACLFHQWPRFQLCIFLVLLKNLLVNGSSVPSLLSMQISIACPSPMDSHDLLRHFGFQEFWLLYFWFPQEHIPMECMDLFHISSQIQQLRYALNYGASTFSLPSCLQIPEVFLLWSFSSFATCPSHVDMWHSI
jgi:hypothetical protein